LFIAAGAGRFAGLAAAMAAGRLSTSLLFGLKPTDPWTIPAAALSLTVATLAAGFLPVQRAWRLDPATALRRE